MILIQRQLAASRLQTIDEVITVGELDFDLGRAGPGA
jgi:hypothetical protein